MSEKESFDPLGDDLDELGMPDTSLVEVQFSPVKKASEFKDKAEKLLSDCMDFLGARVRGGVAESSDLKTIVDIGKMFKVGMETVDEAAARAFAENEEYADLEDDEEDSMMRYRGTE